MCRYLLKLHFFHFANENDMTPVDAKESMDQYLSLLPEKVRTQLAIVTPEQLKQPYLLHISKDTNISALYPFVSTRIAYFEDKSVPRICCAPTLAGCFLGYAKDIKDFCAREDDVSGDHRRTVRWRGGWVVYGVEYQMALRPSNKLVPDADLSDEHWMVTYDQQTIEYRPIRLAKVFYESALLVAGSKYPDSEVTMLVEVLTDTPIRFDNRVVLTKGCWRVVAKGLHQTRRWDKIPSVTAESIARPVYQAKKTLVASMLSLEEAMPVSAFL